MRYGLGLWHWAMENSRKCVLKDGGWLLIRFSGTEPILRVYCEMTGENKVRPLLDEGLRLAGLA